MKNQIIQNSKIGKNTKLFEFVKLYDCIVGSNCIIGPFIEIQSGVKIGDKVKIQSHTFICEGVTIEDKVFIGHGVMFTNDKYPRSTNLKGELKKRGEWKHMKTLICKNASIGSNSTILPGIVIGENVIVGAGSVVTKDIPSNCIVVGNPARLIKKVPVDL